MSKKAEHTIIGIFKKFKNIFQLYFDFYNQLYIAKYHSIIEN